MMFIHKIQAPKIKIVNNHKYYVPTSGIINMKKHE